ncbi:MAG: competence/damage-inducible protein [Crocinitomicaceae bacterium]|jgi:nicotinamide-nucleotide amidase|nr:competence/damage-inducible protein [Crocinitomicaceae bacterium]
MKAEIISIGDELLIGQTINTNASWIGSELALIGVRVCSGQVVSDTREAIVAAFDLAFDRSDLIIVTGGLGPTKDDITKHVLCDYFNTTLKIKEDVLKRIESYFAGRKRPMLDVNIQQAALPEACQVIDNFLGTASGMWFEKDGKVLISLPGVPYEMKGMMQNVLLDKIKDYFKVKALYHKTVMATGIGESFLAEEMKDWEERILADGFGLAYLPSPGIVKLRLTSYKGEEDSERIQAYCEEVKTRLPYHVFGEDDISLAKVVGDLLLQTGETLTTVESCTGGGIASELVTAPGSSGYLKAGLITYTEEMKTKLAAVPPEVIEEFGVVSQETAEAMARGGRERIETEYCLSCTGFAGPDGGDEKNPVGTIWIALATPEQVISKKLNLGDNRERNIKMTIFAALNLLRFTLLQRKNLSTGG